MSKTAMINIRLEPKLKKSSEAILARMGLSTSEAITLFLSQVVMQRGLPFAVRIPNKETRKALKEAKEGRNLESFTDFDAYLKSIK